MNEPLEYRSANVTPGVPGGMIAFGVIALILAALSACVTIVTPLSLFAGRTGTAVSTTDNTLMIGQIITAVLLYLFATVVLATMGIGMVRGKRWARPYTLALAVPFIGFSIAGIFGSIWSIIAIVNADTLPGANPNAPVDQRQAMIIGGIFGALFMVVFSMGLPLAFALYFKSRQLAKRLEVQDPGSYIGDHLPIPALALALWLTFGGFMYLAALPAPTMPAFTTYASGNGARVMLLLIGAALLISAVLVWKRYMAGWYLAAVALLGVMLATTVTPLLAENNIFTSLQANPQAAQMAALFENAPVWPLVLGGLMQLILITIGLLWARPYVARA